MSIKSTILESIVDIGVSALESHVEQTIEKAEIREKIEKYIERQQKYNFNCTVEEEIDFEGLAEYIKGSLIDDVERRLFGTKQERAAARRTIADKAAYYAKSKTRISERRASHIATDIVDMLKAFYRSKCGRSLKMMAAEIEDAIIEEITDKSLLFEQKIDELSQKTECENLLSIDTNLKLVDSGQISQVEDNLSKFFKALGTAHTLSPDYSFGLDESQELKSIPRNQEAAEKYPPRIELTATSAKMGQAQITNLDANSLRQSYNHQIPIEFDILNAKKYLGDFLDPIQREAEALEGAHAVIQPPTFPPAFACNVSIDERVEVDYLLLRTKEIMDDGMIVLSNEEQPNFNFRVELSLYFSTNVVNLSIDPLEITNKEALKYRCFLKAASQANKISLKVLEQNAAFITTNNFTKLDVEQLKFEIALLEKIVAIEEYFNVSFSIPETITVGDNALVERLYSMVNDGEYRGTINRFQVSLEVTEELKNIICDYYIDKASGFAYVINGKVHLFDQDLCFPVMRRLDCVHVDDPARVKTKLAVLDVGDTLKLTFVGAADGEVANYVDAFYSENIEEQLFRR